MPRRGSPSGRQCRPSTNSADQVSHQLDRRAIGPLGILENDERRPGAGGVQQLTRQGADGFAPSLSPIAVISVGHATSDDRRLRRKLLHNRPERIVAVER
jgi:hypothetical protein